MSKSLTKFMTNYCFHLENVRSPFFPSKKVSLVNNYLHKPTIKNVKGHFERSEYNQSPIIHLPNDKCQPQKHHISYKKTF